MHIHYTLPLYVGSVHLLENQIRYTRKVDGAKENSKDISLLGQLSPSQHESHINGVNSTLTDVHNLTK